MNDNDAIKILLIEDNPEDVRLVRTMLVGARRPKSANSTFELVHVKHLSAGVKHLSQEKADVVLLDLLLPDSQGFDTFSIVRTQAPDVPIIILSGLDDEALALEAVQNGAQDYLVKRRIESDMLARSVCYAIERQRMRAELAEYTQKLRASEARFRKIIDRNADGTIIVNEEGVIRFVNPAAEALLDRPAEELLDQMFDLPVIVGKKSELNITRGEGKMALVVELRTVETTWQGESVYLTSMRDITGRKWAETVLQKAKGELEFQVQARTRELRKVNHYLLNQISERKRAERELSHTLFASEQARDRTDAILRSIADGLLVTDIHNRIVMMNQTAENILGVHWSDLNGQSIDMVIESKTLRERIKTTLTRGAGGYQFDFRILVERRQTATELQKFQIIRAKTAVVKDKTHQPTSVITIMYDVTREREVDRMKTEFISTAAHELRTPLTSIQGFSEILLMRDNIEPEARRKYLGYINDQSMTLTRIVEDLLDISRIESGQSFELQRAPCSISQTVSRVVGYFEEKYTHYQFEISLDRKYEEWVVDQEKIEQVLQNLLSNAVKYTSDGDTIRITSQCHYEPQSDMNFYEISVTDQGIGMTPEQVTKIFDKFYRANASNTSVGGVGLGMSIVKHIIEAHGGIIWVDSKLGAGTTVSFTIAISC